MNYLKIRLYCALMVTCLITFACGGGSDSNGGEGSLTIASLSPSNNSENIDRNTSISIAFNEDVLNTSVDDSSLVVDNNQNVQGAIEFDGESNTITFTPEKPLALSSLYTVTASKNIADLTGNALNDDVTWQFSTKDGEWHEPVKIFSKNGDDYSGVQIASNKNGELVAIWLIDNLMDNRPHRAVAVSRFVPSGGWLSPEIISSTEYVADEPYVSLDEKGNIMVVWEQERERRQTGNEATVGSGIWSNYYTPNNGWGEPVNLDNQGYDQRIAADADGNVTLVWSTSNDLLDRNYLWSKKYLVDQGWQNTVRINTGDAQKPARPKLVMNDNGDGIVIWVDGRIDVQIDIRSNILLNDSGWMEPFQIDADADDVVAKGYDVAINNNGVGVVVWTGDYNEIEKDNILSRSFNVESGFNDVNIISESFIATHAKVSINDDSDILIVWFEDMKLVANSFSQPSGWSEIKILDSYNWGLTYNVEYRDLHRVVLDDHGNGMAVWKIYNEFNSELRGSRFLNNNGWGLKEKISENDVSQIFGLAIAINVGNEVQVMWAQDIDFGRESFLNTSVFK